MEYLDPSFDKEMVKNFSEVKLQGRMGDPTETKKYNELSDEPLSKRKKAFANLLRRSCRRKCLAWIGEERLRLMGYDKSGIEKELSSIGFSTSCLLSDMTTRVYGLYYCMFESAFLSYKWRSSTQWVNVHSYR
jgi:hypothetical protein